MQRKLIRNQIPAHNCYEENNHFVSWCVDYGKNDCPKTCHYALERLEKEKSRKEYNNP